jgi:hypothetical protein
MAAKFDAPVTLNDAICRKFLVLLNKARQDGNVLVQLACMTILAQYYTVQGQTRQALVYRMDCLELARRIYLRTENHDLEGSLLSYLAQPAIASHKLHALGNSSLTSCHGPTHAEKGLQYLQDAETFSQSSWQDSGRDDAIAISQDQVDIELVTMAGGTLGHVHLPRTTLGRQLVIEARVRCGHPRGIVSVVYGALVLDEEMCLGDCIDDRAKVTCVVSHVTMEQEHETIERVGKGQSLPSPLWQVWDCIAKLAAFDTDSKSASLPSGMQRQTFGPRFNQSLENHLEEGHHARWHPAGIPIGETRLAQRHPTDSGFNQTWEKVALPSSLELTFPLRVDGFT